MWDAFATASTDHTVIGLANSRPGGERNHRELNLLDFDAVSTFFREVKPNCEYINSISTIASLPPSRLCLVFNYQVPVVAPLQPTSFPLRSPHLPKPHSKSPTHETVLIRSPRGNCDR